MHSSVSAAALGCVVVFAAGLFGVTAAGASASQAASDAPRAAADAQLTTAITLDPKLFPEPAILKPAVGFWEKVFAHYSVDQSMVHSTAQPAKVIRVLDFSAEAKRLDKDALRALRNSREDDAVKVCEGAIKGIVAANANPAKMDALEQHIYTLYGGGDAAKFKALEGTLRAQRGLRERTGHALEVAGRYLPKMEQIFSSYGLPRVLTRLPLVESSFELDAYSKVGAAGIWQFIPSTARIYMTLNAVQDDRRDPWTSTDAAARHLKDDFAALGSWPLAITAYNYGRGGLVSALDQTDDHTLAGLLKDYDNPRFGFASRNFYAEFLAAAHVAAHAKDYFDDLQHESPIRFDVVHTRDYVPYSTLRRLAGASAAQFHMLNPEFDDAVLNGRLYVPPDTAIRVPPGQAQRFQTEYARLGPQQRFARQRVWYVAYRVRRGDVLGRIAHRHGVSISTLVRLNQLRSARRIRIGQVLKIPTGGGAVSSSSPRLIAAADHPRATPRLHKVHSGQTLSGIAARHHTSVAVLRRLNHLRDADDLRAGQLLRIPGNGTRRAAHLIATADHPHARRRPSPRWHRVQSGETLSGIADRFDTTVAAITRLNHLHDADALRAGVTLKISR